MNGNKISLAVKYRPREWDSLVEQDYIKTILQNQIDTNSIKNAYLFCGRGTAREKQHQLEYLLIK